MISELLNRTETSCYKTTFRKSSNILGKKNWFLEKEISVERNLKDVLTRNHTIELNNMLDLQKKCRRESLN